MFCICRFGFVVVIILKYGFVINDLISRNVSIFYLAVGPLRAALFRLTFAKHSAELSLGVVKSIRRTGQQ